MHLGYYTITWGGVTGDAVEVTSLKDLLYRVPGSMGRVLRDIAAAGYAGVEVFDGNVADFADNPQALRDRLVRDRPVAGQRVRGGATSCTERPSRTSCTGCGARRRSAPSSSSLGAGRGVRAVSRAATTTGSVRRWTPSPRSRRSTGFRPAIT
jgi:hypothetical protein